MTVSDPEREVPHIFLQTRHSLADIKVRLGDVMDLLKHLDTDKAVGSDGVSPHFLRNCAEEIAPVMTTLFQTCLREEKWPNIWKHAKVIPVHKKDSKTNPKNYRPIPLLPIPRGVYTDENKEEKWSECKKWIRNAG